MRLTDEMKEMVERLRLCYGSLIWSRRSAGVRSERRAPEAAVFASIFVIADSSHHCNVFMPPTPLTAPSPPSDRACRSLH
jgi:hypothetical protein